jgi:hypothetical protein
MICMTHMLASQKTPLVDCHSPILSLHVDAENKNVTCRSYDRSLEFSRALA